jgi:hypothetical protein
VTTLAPTNRVVVSGDTITVAGVEYPVAEFRDPTRVVEVLRGLQPHPSLAECEALMGLHRRTMAWEDRIKSALYDLMVERGMMGTHACVIPFQELPGDHLVTVTATEWSALLRIREKVRAAVTARGDDLCWLDLYRDLAALVGVTFDPKLIDPARMLDNCHQFVRSLLAGTAYEPSREALEAEILALQVRLTPAERLDFWATLRGDYCRSCGRTSELPCHCRRDE